MSGRRSWWLREKRGDDAKRVGVKVDPSAEPASRGATETL